MPALVHCLDPDFTRSDILTISLLRGVYTEQSECARQDKFQYLLDVNNFRRIDELKMD